VLTTIFVPVFALLEWVAERYVSSQNRAESALLQVGIALILFTSIRWFHAYAERFVDQWLFRERHENETALREFARHVVFITDERTITERTVQTVCDRTEAKWCAIYLRGDAGGSYALASRCGDSPPPVTVAENDAAVVAMRADRVAIEHFADSVLSEALVLPLFARGQLTGFLACGPKRSGESYAPDEGDALMQIARGVATALDGVRLTALEQKVARLEGSTRLQTQS
jgi:GAF domain-containing protein